MIVKNYNNAHLFNRTKLINSFCKSYNLSEESKKPLEQLMQAEFDMIYKYFMNLKNTRGKGDVISFDEMKERFEKIGLKNFCFGEKKKAFDFHE